MRRFCFAPRWFGLIPTLTFVLALVLAPLIAPGASAGQCSGDCEESGCSGGCTINSINCTVGCTDSGCGTTVCQEGGGELLQCNFSVKGQCERAPEGPPSGPDPDPGGLWTAPSPEWAVIEFDTNDMEPSPAGSFRVLAQSAPRLGELVVEGIQRDQERALRHQFEFDPERARKRQALGRALGSFKRILFYTKPAGPCHRVSLDFPQPASAVFAQGEALVLVTADPEGQIVGASLLYSSLEASDLRDLVRYLKREGRVTQTADPAIAIEAFIALSVKRDGSVSTVISGARDLL